MEYFVIADVVVNDLNHRQLILGVVNAMELKNKLTEVFHTSEWSTVENNEYKIKYLADWDMSFYSTRLVHNPVHVTGILGYVSHVTVFLYRIDI